MFLSERATIYSGGLRLPSDAIRRIGVARRSSCWGVWLPYRNPDQPQRHQPGTMPAHLAISPIHPDAWPCLFDISLKIDDETGTANRAVTHLHSLGLDVLSHVFAQTGHNHATLSLIATSPQLLRIPFLSKARDAALAGQRISLDEITLEWAVPVLSEVDRLHRELRALHALPAAEYGQFLRPRFLPSDVPTDVRGLGFKPALLPSEVRKHAQPQFIDAISIRWLQYPAYYWFNGGNICPIRLQADATGTRLKADGSQRAAFQEHLHSDLLTARPVAPVLVSIEPESRIIRVMPLRSVDGPPHLISVRQEYQRHFPQKITAGAEGSSRGILKLLTSAIYEANGNLWHMSNEVHRLGEQADCSDIKFIVTDRRPEGQRTKPLRDTLLSRLRSLKPEQEGLPVKLSRLSIQRLDCMSMFVSKHHDWWTKTNAGRNAQRLLQQSLQSFGYRLVQNPTNPADDPSPSDELRQTIKSQIRQSQGFLLFISAALTKRPDIIQWLEYEIGFAEGAGLACAVLAEDDGTPGLIDNLDKTFKTTKGLQYHKFDTSTLRRRIDDTVRALDHRIRQMHSL